MKKLLTDLLDIIERILDFDGPIYSLIGSLIYGTSFGSVSAFSTESLGTGVPASMSGFAGTAEETCLTSFEAADFTSSVDSVANVAERTIYGSLAIGGAYAVSSISSEEVPKPDFDRPIEVIVRFVEEGTFNYGKYDTVDIRADRIYDMLTKNTKQGMIVVKDSEMADILEEIYSMFDSKEELIVALETYKNLLLEKEKQENDIKVLKREKTID